MRRLGGERPAGMFGINLASNGDSPDPAEDFVGLVQRFASYADYLTLDVSCPNSLNGKVFLDPAKLRDLMARLAAVDRGPMPPKLVAKLSPDVDDALLEQLVTVLLDAKIDGIIVSNTTVERPATLRGDASMRGGLSGPPLFARFDRDARARRADHRRVGSADRPRRNCERTASLREDSSAAPTGGYNSTRRLI